MNPTTILAGLLIVAFAALGSAKLAAVPAMRTKAEHVGFSVPAYRRIGALEVLAVLGLLVGAFVPVIGAMATVLTVSMATIQGKAPKAYWHHRCQNSDEPMLMTAAIYGKLMYTRIAASANATETVTPSILSEPLSPRPRWLASGIAVLFCDSINLRHPAMR